MDPEMPAAVLHRGTSARQKRGGGHRGDAARSGGPAWKPRPSSWVGKVCALAKEFAWAETAAPVRQALSW